MKSNRATRARPAQRSIRHKERPSERTFAKVIPFPRFKRLKGKDRRSFASIGAIAAGTSVIFLANVIGVGELALGAIAAFSAYRIIRYGEKPSKALSEGLGLESREALRGG